MRSIFRERMGLIKARDTFQTESLQPATRGRLWNVVSSAMTDDPTFQVSDVENWQVYFHSFKGKAIPRTLRCSKAHETLETNFVENWSWDEVLEYLDWIGQRNRRYQKRINYVLITDMVAYRFVDEQLVPITDREQISAIDSAIEGEKTAKGAKKHLSLALSHLSPGKVSPQDAIREAITAIEAHVHKMTGKKTLGDGINELRKKHEVNPQFEQALTKLYAYTNTADGIRHADKGLTESASVADAIFFVVTASAFISWLTAAMADN